MIKKNTSAYDTPPVFNIRVYGVIINNNHVLLSEETHNGLEIIKFPGGGMQYGEGTIECLQREFKEELAIDVDVRNHVYTTDFFQPSVFNPSQQVIGIYYMVHSNELSSKVNPEVKKSDRILSSEDHSFRWVPLENLDEKMLTFRTDQTVVKIIIKNHH